MAMNRYSSRMQSFCRKAGTVPNLVLAIVLIVAQSVASAHAFEHEIGTSQNQACTTCVAASQLSAATVDSGTVFTITDSTHDHVEASVTLFESLHTLAVRQRGPPAPLQI